jgi:hypothetical protein
MPMNRIQIHSVMSLSQSLELYSTEVQGEVAQDQTRW